MTRNQFILIYMLRRATFDSRTAKLDLEAAVRTADVIEEYDKTIFDESEL